MSGQLVPIYEPINGEEGKKILKFKLGEKIDLMPMMRQGHSYHQFHIIGNIEVHAYPDDVPVPKIDFDFLVKAPGLTGEQLAKALEGDNKIARLEEIEKRCLNELKRVQDTLALIRPKEILPLADIQAGKTPDELRIKSGLKIPVIQRTGGGMQQVMVDANSVEATK